MLSNKSNNKPIKYLVIADTHLGHKNLVKHGRPEGFGRIVHDNIRRYIANDKHNYVLIHLGDVCWGNGIAHEFWHSVIDELSFHKKWLVRGNHDTKSDTWYLNHGWDFVADRLYLEKYGETILFTHMPEKGWVWEFTFNIHGHFHDSDYERHEPELASRLTPDHWLFALEYTDYKPLDLETIIKKWRKG